MSDEILLYLILLLMLVLAVGALVPSLLRVGREEASVEREDKAYGSAVTEALRRQRAQLDEDLKSGAVSAEQYEILADDLRRRALEEHDAVFHDPNDGAGRRAGSFSGPVGDGRRGGGRHCGFGRPLCRERRARAHRA